MSFAEEDQPVAEPSVLITMMAGAGMPFLSIFLKSASVLENVADPTVCASGDDSFPLQFSLLFGNDNFAKCRRVVRIADVADKETS